MMCLDRMRIRARHPCDARACQGELRQTLSSIAALKIAVGIAECRDRAAANELVDAYWLADVIIDKIHFRQTEQLRPAVAHLELRLDR